jgi:pimeloyl-ACP methyl ester carboxylesterase
VWYLAGPVLTWPIGLLTDAVTRLVFSDIVQTVEQHGHLLTIVSTLRATRAATADAGVISVDVNVLLYSFGLPMLAALILAARQPHAVRRLVLAYFVLAPFVTWGLIAEFLKHLVFDTSVAVASQAGFSPLQREVIAFAYQFGTLILPTVAPAVFWVLTHRRFLESFAADETVR